MSHDSKTGTALVERRAADIEIGGNITTAQDLAVRIREMQDKAFILSPMTAVASLAPGYQIAPTLVVIDPSVDPDSGRGADVYYQSSIHKKHKDGNRWVPDEVSLNHYALLRVLANPDKRRNIAEGTKAALADPEVRKRISDGLKASWAKRKSVKAEGEKQ